MVKHNRWATALLGLSVLGLALLQTQPLWHFFATGIPYGYHVSPGYEVFPLMPGDHLQFHYWCWLMKDNLFGPSSFLTNPYEFNTFLSPGLPGFANFPFSLLYVALSWAGEAAAYNLLVLLSYLLAGVCAYLFAVEALQDRVAAVLAGLVFALLPFRAAQTLSGHLYGFIAFLLPLMLWCLERGLRRRSAWWGAWAGLCLLAMSMMEAHLIYYSALLLGLYVPLRLLWAGRGQGAEPAGGPAQALGPALAGLGLGLAAWLNLSREPGGSLWGPGLPQVLGLYLVLALAAWLLLAFLLETLTSLSPQRARGLAARGMWPLALAPAYAVQLWLDVPHLGPALLAALALAGACLLLPPAWSARRRPRLPAGMLRPVWPLAAGLGLAALRMMQVKASQFNTSIAGGGRKLDEVRLFAPQLGDMFHLSDVTKVERMIHPGWLVLALAGLGLALLAAGRGGRRPAALWAALAGLSGLLCLGPTMKALPLYDLLYRVVPFFNFPRVPGRMVLVAALFLALLAGWAASRGRLWLHARAERPGWVGPALAVVIGGLAAWSLWPGQPVGICLLPPAGQVETTVRAALPCGPNAGQRLLCLPIWPGDSHQSSAYELLISRTRALIANGYSPVVPRAYVEQVFRPLDPLNQGWVTAGALATMDRLRAPLAAFYDDDHIYTYKVSPFPPALTRKRLLASGAFGLAAHAGNVFLLRRLAGAGPDPDPGRVTSPVTSVWQPWQLRRKVGSLVEDRRATGWGELFQEQAEPDAPLGPRKAQPAGNVARALAGGRPGFLSYGPYRGYPPGSYLARFRLRRGRGQPPGWVEVAADGGRRSLARRELDPATLPADGRWHDVALAFGLKRVADLELRTWFNGGADLELDCVLVGFASGPRLPGFFAAADLWRQTGELVEDPAVPGGLAVLARAGYHPPLYLMHGPQVTLKPGSYQARFMVAGQGPQKPDGLVAYLVVATDRGRITLGSVRLLGRDLGSGYSQVPVPFVVKRRCEIGLRVRFVGGGSLRLAGAWLEPAPVQ